MKVVSVSKLGLVMVWPSRADAGRRRAARRPPARVPAVGIWDFMDLDGFRMFRDWFLRDLNDS